MIFRTDHDRWRKVLKDGFDRIEAVREGRDEFRVCDESLVDEMRTALAWYEGILGHLVDGTTADPAMELASQKTAIDELRKRVDSLEDSVKGLRGAQWTHDYELKKAVENMIHILKNVGPYEPWKPKDES